QIRNHLKQNEISLDDSDESKLLMRMDKDTKFVLGNNMKSKKNLYRVHVFVKPKELPKPNIQYPENCKEQKHLKLLEEELLLGKFEFEAKRKKLPKYIVNWLFECCKFVDVKIDSN